MAFRYEKGALRQAATRLDDLQGWVGEARTYAEEHLPVHVLDEGVLNTMMFTHSSVESTTTDYLRDLQTLVGEIATAFRQTDRTYRTVDTDRARVLDHMAGALPAGEVERSKAETDFVPDYYWTITNWTDPSVHLTAPDDDPDIGGPDWWDLLSPTAIINDAVWGVTEFAATIGLIDHPVNIIEELCKPISGDWNAFDRAGDALRHLGYFLDGAKTCFRGTGNSLDTAWEGNASDHARDYLYDLAADVDKAADEMRKAADGYEAAAESAKDYADALGEAVEVCLDTASAALIAAGAAGAAGATGFGLPIALIAGAYGLSKIKKVVSAVKAAFSAYETFKGVKSAYDAATSGFGVVSGYLPLPPVGQSDVPVVKP